MTKTFPHQTESSKRVLLAVLAHPDDESFGMGGTLTFYAQHGVAVHLICATRGEAGEADEAYLQGHISIADLREKELRCAAGFLRLAGLHFLDYRDSGMAGSPDNQHPRALANAPIDQVAAKIVHYIRQLRPDVVLTFDPVGGYRHPDHIAIHQATVRAFFAAADPQVFPNELPPHQPGKLYFHSIPKGLLRWMTRIMKLIGKDPRRFGRNADIDLEAISTVDLPTHTIIDYRSVAEARIKASACHASQGGARMNTGISGLWQRLSAKDKFMRAYPPPAPGHIERDLFEGL